jgi:hypothetical protein
MQVKLSFIVYLFILIATTIYGLLSLKKLDISYKMLVVLIVVSCSKELLDKFVYHQSSEGSYLGHLLLLMTLILNMLIYLPQWEGNVRLKKFVKLISIGFFVLVILNTIYIQDFGLMPTNGLVLLCIQSVGFSLLSFKIIVNLPANEPIYNKPLFWLSISNLIFYTVMYLVLAFFHFYKFVGEIGNWLPFVALVSNYLLYIGYGVAIYVHKNKLNVHSR